MPAKKPLAIIAFGGNALAPDPERLSIRDQYPVVKKICSSVVDAVESGWNVVVTHGNGPQVGIVMRRVELTMDQIVPVTLDYAVAYTQGSIGNMFSLALGDEFRRRGLPRQALAAITQTLVDAGDPAFENPTKPIGSWYDRKHAEELAGRYNWRIVEDAGRGWRRVVPSPRPVGIVQLPVIRSLLDNGVLPVTLGGGGIPVVRDDKGEFVGVEAVIDKDLASSLLARELGADLLVFPTGVERVAIRYKQPDQRWLDSMSLAEARDYRRRGEFHKGSMEPKILALMEFVEATGGTGVITSLEKLPLALEGKAGTRLVG